MTVDRTRLLAIVRGDTPPTAPEPNGYLIDQLISWPEFWAHDHGTEEWLAWPIIPAHRQTALYAPAKTGKSIIALAVCAALAAGQPILGQPAQPPRHVLYLDYEMTGGDLQERLESLGYGPDTNLSHLHYALLPSLPPLNTTQGAVAVCTLARDTNADLVVIDTMGRAVDVGDENSSTAYQEFARTTGLALKAAGRAVLRTDHAGKERDRGQRGSSAKNDDVDLVLRIDIAEGGWQITRTHTRIAWVPERIVINRHDHSDGTIELTVATETRTYTPGTKDLADLLRNHGATATTSHRQARDMIAQAGEKARNKRVSDALTWIRAETPTFTTEPALHPAVQAVEDAMTDRLKRSGNTSGNTPSVYPNISAGNTEPRNDETPGHSVGEHCGEHGEHGERVDGEQCPPLKGAQCPNPHPEPDPRLDFDPFN